MTGNKTKGLPQFGSLDELVEHFDTHDLASLEIASRIDQAHDLVAAIEPQDVDDDFRMPAGAKPDHGDPIRHRGTS